MHGPSRLAQLVQHLSRRGLVLAASAFTSGVASHPLVRCESTAPAPPVHTVPDEELFNPKVPYPRWDKDWDHLAGGRKPGTQGVSRHIILVRHGQYDESSKEDSERILTDLGRVQAAVTGERLADLLAAHPAGVMHVSSMTRAKETADIIATKLPSITRSEPDPLLAEGRPAHNIPCSKYREAKDHDRIEEAFQKYFERNTEEVDKKDHKFEIVVCHGNVIRYFVCRALQIPPEAWLRMSTFNCSLTYIVIRPNGNVSLRGLGDIGHLDPELISWSQHHGLAW
eukprot:TRINITY_DN4088_c0_g1_i1.p1 TRINITY_DN4088_c0_g1~~TRINITY_DN4088_c0_g1_i1.p1  ORF type:complete len:283 (-),score=41.03 TRINITY_DN4088_c0_g1_i1:99-947(-)